MFRVLRAAPAAASVLTILALGGCATVPADVDGTTDRISGGVLRVGITANPPWTDLSGAEPTGTEVELIEGFAREQDAEIEWTEGSESVLADALHEGALDVAVGGFTDDTPFMDKAALTDVYTETRAPAGTEKHVMLARAGENRLLVTLEEYLRANGARS
ncbi:transporter substrate-binding domain-containing protein [Microbacterium sp. 179-B 1A2 NHS]|uniref:transporter substrate-binding domain-containing protein n=1 Tax=Microbacterium sp. 179-B 1A2 NHS TaxID=3142383 RepID=UPI0039A2836B